MKIAPRCMEEIQNKKGKQKYIFEIWIHWGGSYIGPMGYQMGEGTFNNQTVPILLQLNQSTYQITIR